VSFGRRLIAAAAAFVLALVAVTSVLVKARHTASATFLAHEIGSDATRRTTMLLTRGMPATSSTMPRPTHKG
jgi:hypothetical protein